MKFLFLPIVPILVLASVGCSLDPKKMSENYVEKGNSYFDRGRLKEASIMYRKALQKDLRSASAWYHLGLTTFQLKAYREARRDFMRALELDPANLDAYVRLADLNLAAYWADPASNEGALNDAQDAIQMIEKKAPNSFDAMRLGGFLALYRHDYKQALTKLKEANGIKPDQPEVIVAMVRCLYILNDAPSAERAAMELIERNKAYAPIYDLLYQQYLLANRPDEAEQILKRKVSNNPKVGTYAVQLAAFYAATHRTPEADSVLNKLASDADNFPDGHRVVGDFYVQTGQLDQALGEYTSGRKQHPKESRSYDKRIVQTLALQGKTKEAAQLLSRLLADDPKDAEALTLHSSLMVASGDKEQIRGVVTELSPLVQKMPENTTLHYNLAQAYMAIGGPDELQQARLQLQQTVKLSPSYLPARLALAQVELSQSNPGRAVEICDDVLRLDQYNLPAMLLKSTALYRMRDADKARAQLLAAIQRYPNSLDAHYDLAILNLGENRLSDAEAEFQRLRSARDLRGLIGLAQVQLRLGKTDDAMNLLRSELKEQPNQLDLRRAIATVEYVSGRYKEAEADFQVLADRFPGSGEPMVHVGETRLAMGDTAGAAAAFSEAHKRAPGDPVPLLHLGLISDRNGSREESQKMFEEALKLDPNNAVALNALAFQKAEDGVDLDRALAYAQRAQQQQPNEVNYIDTLGLVYLRKSLTEDSLRLLQNVVSRDPNRAVFHLHLAMAYVQKGDFQAAKKELEAASKDRPTAKEREKIDQLMAKVG